MFPDNRGVSPSVMSDITHCKLPVTLKGLCLTHSDPELTPHCAPDVLELWHEHRIPIIMSTLFVLSLLRIYLHSTQKREELQALPKVYEKVPQNGSARLDEKPKPSVKEEESEGSDSTSAGIEKRGDKARA